MGALRFLASWLRVAAHGAGAGAVASLVFVLVDTIGRTRWGAEGPLSHVVAAGGLLAAFGAVAMATMALVTALPSSGGTARFARVAPWARADLAPVAVGAALVAAALSSVVVRAPAFGVSFTGPLRVLLPMAGFFTAAAVGLAWRAAARRATRPLACAAHVLGSVVAAVVLLALDGRVLRGRHSGIHLAIEIVAFFLLAGAIARVTTLSARVRRACVVAGAGALVWSALLLGSRARREDRVLSLRHLTDEPSSAGMLYARARSAFTRPAPPPPPSHPEIERWRGGEQETPEQSVALARLRSVCADCNIVVYFVDTLRADTANDPAVMPSTAAFSRASIRFPSAYSTASDTLRALTSVFSGRYDDGGGESGLLRHIRARGVDNALFISTSAHDYLSTQLPDFRFDEVVTVPDHAGEVPVWGYGADTPTGQAVVRSALAWMRARHEKRFFTWIYNFDLHGWRQIRDEHLRPRYREDPTRPEKRYRAVATMVDKSFRSLLGGLDQLGLADNTIVVLVSDHGEALGYRGFWTHSTFLWQSLVRVPLAIRVPGLEARELSAHVSLVDLTPTLSRFLDPFAEVAGYHGLDLLRFYVDPDADRALPLLMHASSEGKTTLFGLVTGSRKLVVASEGGPPLLHDLAGDDPDDTDLALTEPDRAATLLDQLTASPLMTFQ